jgi:alpha-beta hydrolase superfamily lysophospholipase
MPETTDPTTDLTTDLTAPTWTPDPVLPGFERATLPFPNDYDGPVVATLVRARPAQPTGRAVLYVHGFVDYFFQTHLAEAYLGRGFAFYALDLRKHGRSLLPGQHPNFCKDVSEYFPDVTAAIEVIAREEGEPFLLVNGHSTGALVAALYAAEGAERARVSALFLNSPFFALNTNRIGDAAAAVLGALGAWLPFVHVPGVFGPVYGESLHCEHRGEWTFDVHWKPIAGFPVYLGWLRAIRSAHRRVARGLRIEVPTLVMHAEKSCWGRRWTEEFRTADGVLDVADIRRLARSLGANVTTVAIPDAVHDLVLSRAPAREAVFAALFAWLEKIYAGRVERVG